MTMTLINDSGINYQPNQATAVEMWGAKLLCLQSLTE